MRNDFSENTASGRVTSAMPKKNKGLTITCKFGILQESGIDSDYEILFERGIDPEDESAVGRVPFRWPAREAIQAYGDRADQVIRKALLEKDVVRATLLHFGVNCARRDVAWSGS